MSRRPSWHAVKIDEKQRKTKENEKKAGEKQDISCNALGVSRRHAIVCSHTDTHAAETTGRWHMGGTGWHGERESGLLA